MKRKTSLLITCSVIITTPTSLLAADPVIHVQWDDGGTPNLDEHYSIDTTATGTPAFPDVKLLAGHLDWRVWSTDADNTADDYVGDIGVISSPADANFKVKLLDDGSTGYGARNVKGIHLVPTNSGKYGSLIGDVTVGYSQISGALQDELTVQADTSGNGGEVALSMGYADITADMTIHKVTRLETPGTASGTIAIDELATTMTFGTLTGSITVQIATGSEPGLRVFEAMTGSFAVEEMVNEGQSPIVARSECSSI
jgi:hypothetical protein